MSLANSTSASLCSVVDTWVAVVSVPSSEPQAESPSPMAKVIVSARMARMVRWVHMRSSPGVSAGGIVRTGGGLSPISLELLGTQSQGVGDDADRGQRHRSGGNHRREQQPGDRVE